MTVRGYNFLNKPKSKAPSAALQSALFLFFEVSQLLRHHGGLVEVGFHDARILESSKEGNRREKGMLRYAGGKPIEHSLQNKF